MMTTMMVSPLWIFFLLKKMVTQNQESNIKICQQQQKCFRVLYQLPKRGRFLGSESLRTRSSSSPPSFRLASSVGISESKCHSLCQSFYFLLVRFLLPMFPLKLYEIILCTFFQIVLFPRFFLAFFLLIFYKH